MESISIGYVAMVLLGLTFGSFAGASVWRLRARQLVGDNADFEELEARIKEGKKLSRDESEYLAELTATKPVWHKELARLRPLTKASLKDDRSRCLGCHHELAWYDLLPLVSWISTKGKCRYCKQPIGWFEPLMELGTVIAFVAFYANWSAQYGPLGELWLLALWLVVIVMLVILFAYDAKWFILPDRVAYPLIGLAAILAIIKVAQASEPVTAAASAGAGVALLGGLYYMLWKVSGGRWVGFGDVKLGLALGLLLADWRLAFLTLFLANLIGTILVLPGLLTKKLSRQTQVPFGPLLILGFALALLYGEGLIGWFDTLSVWLTSSTLML